jgi:hypothetical protein
MENGGGVQALIAEMRAVADELTATDGTHPLELLGVRLEHAVDAAENATAWISERRSGADGVAGATPYLAMMGDLIGGWLLIKGAIAASGEGQDVAFGKGRVALASHYAEAVLARVPGQVASVIAGAATLKALDAAALGA